MHLRGDILVQNIGRGKCSAGIFCQLYHGIVIFPEVTEPDAPADSLHIRVKFFCVAPLRDHEKNILQGLVGLLLFRSCLFAAVLACNVPLPIQGKLPLPGKFDVVLNVGKKTVSRLSHIGHLTNRLFRNEYAL